MKAKYYDDDDVKYYVEEAKKDLQEYGMAIFQYKDLIRLGDKIYRLERPKDVDPWSDKEPRYHEFVELDEGIDKALTDEVIDQNGYKGGPAYTGPMYRLDALKILKMGYQVSHERYNSVFKMVDGQIYDRLTDEPDKWYPLDLSQYDNPDILTNDEYIGWKIVY